MLSARGMVEDRVRLTNIIDVYINHLRRKIEGDHEPRLIHAVRRLGYVIRDAHAAH
jgi:DNA-binding response OmpR family regulator